MRVTAFVTDRDGQEWYARGVWVGPRIEQDADDYGDVEDCEVSMDGEHWLDPLDAGLDPWTVSEALAVVRFER